ncbi:efflux transporter, RND family, MFP subunit [Rickettsia felis str. Pedreira]|uniref:Efflux transporter, RND family, MFP subunit n=2 Tax=Rickettsia felis TaxID=42862 RepID=A0A0F3MPY0_RICFI|nr:efflux transporter, RND family, MFP subunit [Rickettsia felis str. Pedreira]
MLKTIIDFLHNAANKEEFVGDTERSTAAYTLVREDASTGSTHKLPLEASYARRLMRNLILITLLVLAVILVVWVIKHHHKSNKQIIIAAPVEVTKVIKKDVPYVIELAGAAETYQSADIRPQVTGQILSVNFDDGQEVKAGDLLYEIDSRPFQNQLQQAQANLLSDTYNLENAIKEEARYRALYQEKAVSEEQYLQMLTNMNMLKASVERDKAIIADANLQIEYSKIVAPFDGKLSESNVDIGDLVSPDFASLVTINTISPIYVSFSVPEEYLDRINKSQKSNDLALTVRTVNDQEIKDGEIVFVDNAIDPNSGTIKVKATLLNNDEILWPGQFVRVSLTIYIEKAALIVPSKAMQTNDQGPYVFVVNKDNKAVVKNIDIVFSNDDFIVIKSGIDEGETVITNGQLRLSNGTEVSVREE